MSDYEELKQDIGELRIEVREGFRELREWRRSVDTGMKGDADHDVWGYKQKINHNRNLVRSLDEKYEKLKDKVNRIYWTAIGAAAVAGSAAAIIFNLISNIL